MRTWPCPLSLIVSLLLIPACAGHRPAFDEKPLFPTSAQTRIREAVEPTPARVGQPSQWIKMDLPATLALAGANDLEIMHANERLMELEAHRDEALMAFFPRLLPGIAFRREVGEYQATAGRFVDVTRQQTLAGVRARLEVVLGSALFDLSAAEHRADGGSYVLKARRHARLLEAARRYYDLVASVQAVEISREAETFAEAQLAYHESRRRQGFGLTLDVERAKARLAGEQAALALAEMGYRAASNRLAIQLRLDPRIWLYPDEKALHQIDLIPPESSLDALIERTLAANPELDAAREHLQEAEAKLDAATYGWLIPTLFVEGSVDARGENPGNFGDTDRFTAGVEWEISMGIGARKRSAAAARNQAAILLARAREHLVAGVVAIKDQIELTGSRIAASERRIAAAEASLRIANSRMRAGSGLMLDVLDARVEVTEASLSRLDAITDYNKNQVSLLVLTGTSPAATGNNEQ